LWLGTLFLQPDIVLYFDRLDIPMRDFGDLPLLRIVTETFGPAVWFNAIVVLTHACTAPPDGTNGQPIRCHIICNQTPVYTMMQDEY
jgi:hypothetical protein